MLKRLLAAAALLLALATPVFAQQGAANAVLIGRGAGHTGVNSATIGTGGRVLVDKGASTDPAFTVVSGDGALASSGALTLDAELHCIAGLTSAADKLAYYTGSGTCSLTDLVANARTLIGHTFSQMRTDLALVIGTNVQAWDADLDTWAGVTPGSGAATAIAAGFTSAVQSVLDDASIAAMDTTLGLGTGSSPQFTCVEVGAASDTSLCRSAAAQVSVEGVNLYAGIPNTSKSAAYTLVLGDANTAILHPASDANNRAFTIPANSSVAYPVNTTLSFINLSANSITIPITTDTMTLIGSGATGTRTLAQYGYATAQKITSTTWIIMGINLT